VLDWNINYTTCIHSSSSACRSNNSGCENTDAYGHRGGHLCHCSQGYDGNPYISDGCQGKNSTPVQFSQGLANCSDFISSRQLSTVFTQGLANCFIFFPHCARYRRVSTSRQLSVPWSMHKYCGRVHVPVPYRI
jgi:hypothetical protein